MRKRRGQTRISGSIGGGFEYPDMDVEGKKIKIIGEKKTYETKTDKNGVFRFMICPRESIPSNLKCRRGGR
jgi:hypothetical protein